jgi:hypothetical protein
VTARKTIGLAVVSDSQTCLAAVADSLIEVVVAAVDNQVWVASAGSCDFVG